MRAGTAREIVCKDIVRFPYSGERNHDLHRGALAFGDAAQAALFKTRGTLVGPSGPDDEVVTGDNTGPGQGFK